MFFINIKDYIQYRQNVIETASRTDWFFNSDCELNENDIQSIFNCSKEESSELLKIINKIKSQYYTHSSITIFLIKQLLYKISLKYIFDKSKLSYKQFKIYLEYIANKKVHSPIDFYIYYIGIDKELIDLPLYLYPKFHH